MRKMREKKKRWWPIVILPLLLLFFYCLQRFWAHRDGCFVPDYPRVVLTENSDYETIFEQTGLGKQAVDKLISEGDFETILKVQDAFFSEDRVECKSVFGWFTMSDRVDKEASAPLVDLQPGDILLSLSTHSVGWRHGHVGFVLDEEHVLECTTLGKNSSIVKTKHWQKYSNYLVLRIKGVTEELQEQVVAYAKEYLHDIPYHLTAGFIGEKAPDLEEPYFGLQCAYLVWYAWQAFGYDLDSDGGRLVTADDILHSKDLDVVQVYGLDFRQVNLFQNKAKNQQHKILYYVRFILEGCNCEDDKNSFSWCRRSRRQLFKISTCKAGKNADCWFGGTGSCAK